jgi:hypothetical protein
MGAAGLIVSVWLVPFPVARGYLYPLAWLWPIVAWSQLGSRQVRHGVEDVVFSVPHPLARQLPMEWGAGVAVGAVLVSTMVARLVGNGSGASVLGLASSLLAVPALAVAVGAWTGNGRLFELLYLIAWYVGPWQHVPLLDFAATTPDASVARQPTAVLVLGAVLLGVAALGRARGLGTTVAGRILMIRADRGMSSASGPG